MSKSRFMDTLSGNNELLREDTGVFTNSTSDSELDEKSLKELSLDFSFSIPLQFPELGSTEYKNISDKLRDQIKNSQKHEKILSDDSNWLLNDSSYSAKNLKGFTENGADTFVSSGSARLDFFYKVVDSTSTDMIYNLLSKAWNENALDTLQLIAHLRDVRCGKADRTYEALAWLLEYHPLTLIDNLNNLVAVGYWKDLLMILQRKCLGGPKPKNVFISKTKYFGGLKPEKFYKERSDEQKMARYQVVCRQRERNAALERLTSPDEIEALKKQFADELRSKEEAAIHSAALSRRTLRLSRIQHARRVFSSDPVYRLLHLEVARLFAEALKADMNRLSQLLSGSEVTSTWYSSLAAKWAPSPHGDHDKTTLITSTVAEFLFPPSEHQGGEEAYANYVKRIRCKYQREVLTPLRRASRIPEVFMSARKWDELDYSHVASTCMMKNKEHFARRDKERFEAFLDDVLNNRKKIASKALKPHEIVQEILVKDDLTAELQWKSYVESLRSSGSLSKCLAVADVSGSMVRGEGDSSVSPLNVAVALSLLLSEVAAPPFDNVICTFSARPRLHRVFGDTLRKRVRDVQRMDWMINTNVDAVFDLILKRAVDANLPAKDMLTTIFIFSDMEFDDAMQTSEPFLSVKQRREYRENRKDTNFQVAKDKFEAHGYTLPRIVFWNLRGDGRSLDQGASVPVLASEGGTALISGYSGHLIKLFMDGNLDGNSDVFSPMSLVNLAIKSGKYDSWHVVD